MLFSFQSNQSHTIRKQSFRLAASEVTYTHQSDLTSYKPIKITSVDVFGESDSSI